MEASRRRQPLPIDPEAFVVAHRIDHERVALPPADRVTVEGWLEPLRVRAAIRVDRPVGVRAADVEDVDSLDLGQLDEFHAVRRQELAREAGRLAAGVRFELVLSTVREHRSRPWLEWELLRILYERLRSTTARQKDALLSGGQRESEQRTALRVAWHRSGGTASPRRADAADAGIAATATAAGRGTTTLVALPLAAATSTALIARGCRLTALGGRCR